MFLSPNPTGPWQGPMARQSFRPNPPLTLGRYVKENDPTVRSSVVLYYRTAVLACRRACMDGPFCDIKPSSIAELSFWAPFFCVGIIKSGRFRPTIFCNFPRVCRVVMAAPVRLWCSYVRCSAICECITDSQLHAPCFYRQPAGSPPTAGPLQLFRPPHTHAPRLTRISRRSGSFAQNEECPTIPINILYTKTTASVS